MIPTAVAQSEAIILLIFGATALLFAWFGWHVGRRWGGWGLLLTWVVGTLLLTTLMAIRIHQQEAAVGFTAAQQRESGVFQAFLPMWAIGLGAATLVLRRRLRTDVGKFSAGTASRSIGAFFAGVISFFLVYLVLDIIAVFTGQ